MRTTAWIVAVVLLALYVSSYVTTLGNTVAITSNYERAINAAASSQ